MKYCEYHNSKSHDTDECMVLRKEIDEKQLTGDLLTILKDLRSMFEVDQRNTRDRKDVGKRQVKEEILTIMRPCKRSELCKTDDDIEVLPKNILNIIFFRRSEDVGLEPKGSALITACICKILINRVYIDNDSGTDILYEHCFQQLLISWKESLTHPTIDPLTGFTGHRLWPLGTIHLPLTITSHDRRDRIT